MHEPLSLGSPCGTPTTGVQFCEILWLWRHRTYLGHVVTVTRGRWKDGVLFVIAGRVSGVGFRRANHGGIRTLI
jgi:hypothetical protein